MKLSPEDIAALWLTLKLATLVTLLLIVIATPLAWWLARSKHWFKHVVAAVVALPLVLPPTVLGFYFLIAMAPDGFLGQLLDLLGLPSIAFTFSGLVIASMLYSLPFVVQPIQNAFVAIGNSPLEVAATLRSSPVDRFIHVVLPMAKPGYITAAILGFAHTLGEFGVVLMIGGNIPEQTRVASIQIYDHVEALEYGQAHGLSLVLLVFSFVILLTLFSLQHKQKQSINVGTVN